MSNSIKVSIVVPIYNVQDYLENCIESLINQSYKNIEILLVNDGSPDNSKSIIDDYAKKDVRIIPIHQENKGAAYARANGINNATGEYLTFVDGDDELTHNAIERLVEYAKKGYDIVSGTFVAVHKTYRKKNKLKYKGEIRDKNNFLNEIIRMNVFMALHARLFNRNLFEDIIVKPLKVGQDAYLCLQLFDKAEKVFCVNEGLYLYNQREESTTYNISEEYINHRLLLPDEFSFLLKNRKEFVDSLNVYKLRIFIIVLSLGGYSFVKYRFDEIDNVYIKYKRSLRCLERKRFEYYKKSSVLGGLFEILIRGVKKVKNSIS